MTSSCPGLNVLEDGAIWHLSRYICLTQLHGHRPRDVAGLRQGKAIVELPVIADQVDRFPRGRIDGLLSRPPRELVGLPGVVHHDLAGLDAWRQLDVRLEGPDIVLHPGEVVVAQAARFGIAGVDVHYGSAALEPQEGAVGPPD